MGIIRGTPNRTDRRGDANRVCMTRLHVQTTRPANELLTWSCPPGRRRAPPSVTVHVSTCSGPASREKMSHILLRTHMIQTGKANNERIHYRRGAGQYVLCQRLRKIHIYTSRTSRGS